MRACFWVVVWANDLEDALKNHPQAIRVCWQKTRSPREACKDTFGMVSHTNNMWLKPFTRFADYRSTTYRKKFLIPEGFKKLTDWEADKT